MNRSLNKHGIGLAVGLIVQYVLGMASNIFIIFPNTRSDAKLWRFAWGQIPIASHIILGILLVLGSLVLLVRAVILKDKPWSISALVGFICIAIASLSGAMYIPSQQGAYSFIMSLAFIAAFLAYIYPVYKYKKTI